MKFISYNTIRNRRRFICKKVIKASIKIDQDICKIKGLPIAGYDDELDCPYIEYPDGKREYVKE